MINHGLIEIFLDGARRLGIVHGMAGGEKRGYISPNGDFIELAEFHSHDNLAKTLGFSGSKELIDAGLVRVSHSDYDMNYEFSAGNDEGIENINASISWNIGMETWPRKADILIDIVDQGSRWITTEDFVNAGADLKKLL